MKTYICTKVIHAVPVKMVNGIPWPDGLPLPQMPEAHFLDDCTCGINEKFIIEDGYMYTTSKDDKYPQYMSAADFESMCRPEESMAFGDALEAMKHGERVAREGWNGKDMYIFIACEPDFVTDADISAFDNQDVESGDVICMKTAQNTFQLGWLASQADMLAEDWYIVE
jgi:hypothetical protein